MLPPHTLVRAGGHWIHVRQAGEGPDVVLLHGMGDSSLGWRDVGDALVRAGFRVTAWDALGAGLSEKPADGDYSLAAHVARLVEVLDALGIARAHVVGHSRGGSVALMLAQVAPERISRLVLIDSAAYTEGVLDGRWFWEVPAMAEVVIGFLPAAFIARYGLARNLRNPARVPDDWAAQYAIEAARPGGAAAFIAQERQVVPADPARWEAGHRDIRQPTLILWGAEDGLVPPAQGFRLVREMPDARRVLIEGVGHSPHLEASTTVAREVVRFLRAGRPLP